MSRFICPLPWKHISTMTNGNMRACCLCIYEPFGVLKKENGEVFHASKDSFLEARNAQLMKDMRRDMLAGKQPEICKLCWDDERVGAISRRQNELKKSKELMTKAVQFTEADGSIDNELFPLTYVDLRLGNQCNLRCRYCGPTDSNSWYADFARMAQEKNEPLSFNMFGKDYELSQGSQNWTVNSEDFNWPQDPRFLRMIDDIIDHSEVFYFTGGEPLLLQSHWDILAKCIEKGVAEKIYLEYNSNMTFLLDKHLETWKHFRGVGIGCSIDGVGNAASYLRPPVEWSKIEVNLEKIATANFRIDAILSTTLSVFNVLKFKDIIDYSLRLKKSPNFSQLPTSHFLEYPLHYSIKILPKLAKEHVITQYNEFEEEYREKLSESDFNGLSHHFQVIKQYLQGEDQSHLIRQFYRETERLDELRGQKFKDVFPEIHDLLQMKSH